MLTWGSKAGIERNFGIWTARKHGETYASIASRYGLSVSRCAEIVKRIDRLNRWAEARNLPPFGS